MPAKNTASLEAELEAARAKGGCVVAKTIRDDPNGATIEKYVNDLGYGAERLVDVLARRDITMSTTGIRRHRRHKCPCYVGPNAVSA